MLILTHHAGQLITLQPNETLRTATPLGRVFADGPIEILVARVWGQQVSLGIKAHPELVIHRCEAGEIRVWRGEG